MVLQGMCPAASAAVRMSACIENSGQCTALRHLVAARDEVSDKSVVEALSVAAVRETPDECLQEGTCSAGPGTHRHTHRIPLHPTHTSSAQS